MPKKEYDFSAFNEVKNLEETPKVTDEKEIDFSAFDSNLEEEEEKMGILEAIGIKIPQGMTLGTSPVFAGIQKGAEVLEDLLSPSGAPATYKGMPIGKPKDPEKIERYETLSEAVERAKDKYYQGKEERIALEEKAQEDQPYVSLGTEMLSSIPTTGGLGALANVATKGGKIAKVASKFLPQTKNIQKASALSKAGVYALEGAGIGGLQGLTRGESRLLEGDLLGTLEETAAGAGMGATAGVLLPTAGSAIKQSAKLAGKGISSLPGVKALKTGYKAGEEGINILEDKQIQQFVKSESNKIKQIIGSLFGEEKASDLLKKYDEQGLVVNVRDVIEEAKDEISKGSYTAEGTKQLNNLLNELNKVDINFDAIKQQAIAKAEKQQAAKINKLAREGAEVETRTEFDKNFEDLSPLPETKGRVIGVEDRIKLPSGGEKKVLSQVSSQQDQVPLKQIDFENAKISEIEDFRRNLYDYTNPEKYKSEVNQITKNVRKRLSDKIDDSLKSSQYSEKRQELNKLFNAFDRLGIDKNQFMSKNIVDQDKVNEMITQAATANPNSTKGRAFSDAMDYLKSIDEEKVLDIEKRSDFLNNLTQFARQSDAEGTVDVTRAVIGAAQKGIGKAGNIAGLAKRAAGNEISQAKSALTNVIKESTPDNLKFLAEELSNKYGQTATKYINQLNKMADLPSSRRNSYVFALMQDKAFKQMIGSLGMQEAQASDDITQFMQGGQIENTTDINMPSDTSGIESKKKVENTREPQGKPSSSKYQPLLEKIAKGEGTSREMANKMGYESEYDTTLGFGKFDPKGYDKPVSQMNLSELEEFQRLMRKHPNNRFPVGGGKYLPSSAVGKYQIVGTTLKRLKNKLGLSDDVIFTPDLQDRLAIELMKEAGLKDYESGKITSEEFQNKLSKVWASIEGSSAGQRISTKSNDIQPILKGLLE